VGEGEPQTQKVKHRVTLMRLNGADLESARASGSIDCLLDVEVPAETHPQWWWRISVHETTQALSPLQEKAFETMVSRHIPKDIGEEQRELLARELRKAQGRGAAGLEHWYAVRITGSVTDPAA
jgi:hypothetical protein